MTDQGIARATVEQTAAYPSRCGGSGARRLVEPRRCRTHTGEKRDLGPATQAAQSPSPPGPYLRDGSSVKPDCNGFHHRPRSTAIFVRCPKTLGPGDGESFRC